MEKDYAHYTNFGISIAPACADAEGFVPFRVGFESLPQDKWTDGERWIDAQNRRIAAWQDAN